MSDAPRAGGGEQKLVEARAHAKKYLSGSGDYELLGKAAGLLAYKPWNAVEPYAVRPHDVLCKPNANSKNNSPFTLQPAGSPLPLSSLARITLSILSPRGPFCTLHSPPAYRLSKRPPAIPPILPPPVPSHYQPQHPYAPSAAPSLMTLRATCRTRTIQRVSLRRIPWFCRTGACTGSKGCRLLMRDWALKGGGSEIQLKGWVGSAGGRIL